MNLKQTQDFFFTCCDAIFANTFRENQYLHRIKKTRNGGVVSCYKKGEINNICLKTVRIIIDIKYDFVIVYKPDTLRKELFSYMYLPGASRANLYNFIWIAAQRVEEIMTTPHPALVSQPTEAQGVA